MKVQELHDEWSKWDHIYRELLPQNFSPPVDLTAAEKMAFKTVLRVATQRREAAWDAYIACPRQVNTSRAGGSGYSNFLFGDEM